MTNITKLQELSARVIDVVIDEADPDNWPGAGVSLKDQTEEERGDRYWCKKNANQSITLAVKLQTLIGICDRGGQVDLNQINAVENKVIDFEKKAKARLSKIEKAVNAK